MCSLISASDWGNLRHGFLLCSHQKLGLHPESLGSAIGNIAGIEILLNVLFVSVVDQTQVTQASHDRRASTTRCVGHLKLLCQMIKIAKLTPRLMKMHLDYDPRQSIKSL